MDDLDLEVFERKSFESKYAPIIIKSEGSSFKAEITLDETNDHLCLK